MRLVTTKNRWGEKMKNKRRNKKKTKRKKKLFSGFVLTFFDCLKALKLLATNHATLTPSLEYFFFVLTFRVSFPNSFFSIFFYIRLFSSVPFCFFFVSFFLSTVLFNYLLLYAFFSFNSFLYFLFFLFFSHLFTFSSNFILRPQLFLIMKQWNEFGLME